MKFVSLVESSSDPQKSILTYLNDDGSTITKEIAIRLSELEETVATVDIIDPDDLANFLLTYPDNAESEK